MVFQAAHSSSFYKQPSGHVYSFYDCFSLISGSLLASLLISLLGSSRVVGGVGCGRVMSCVVGLGIKRCGFFLVKVL